MRWLRSTRLMEEAICAALEEAAAGLVDADLGGGLVKKRVALPGRGKRGGARIVVATNRTNRWYVIVGFAKSVRADLDSSELKALRAMASDLLGLSALQLEALLERGVLREICHGSETEGG